MSDPVTVIFRRRVKAGSEDDYEAWLTRITTDARAFDGYLGAEFHRPAGNNREYVTVLRFEGIETLERFRHSEVMESALVDVAPFIESDAVVERITGLEFWFNPPEGTIVAMPSRHRMALLMMVVMFVLMISANMFLAPLVSWPPPIKMLFIVGLQVGLMTYVIMPWLSRLLSRWIYPKARAVD